MRNENGKSIRGQEGGEVRRVIKDSLFPVSLFAIYLGVLFLMSGIHEGLLVLMNKRGWNEIIQTAVPMLYWGAVAVGLTLFTRKKIKDTYEAGWQRPHGRWRGAISPCMCPQCTRRTGWTIWM